VDPVGREKLSITGGPIRLSVGVKHPEDMIWDLGQALKAVFVPLGRPGPNFTQRNNCAMTAIDLRSEIVQMIKEEHDTSILEAIRILLYKLRGAEVVNDDLTDEEVAELESRFQDMVSGKVKPVGEKESIRMIIEAAKSKA
jgi:hypothetical protein